MHGPQAGFGYDFEAVKLEPNRVIHALPRALEEIQRRMTNPLQVCACSEARPVPLAVTARQAAEGAQRPQALWCNRRPGRACGVRGSSGTSAGTCCAT